MNLDEIAPTIRADITKEIKRLLSKRPMSIEELKEETHLKLDIIKSVIKEIKTSGLNFAYLPGDKLFLPSIVHPGGHHTLSLKDRNGFTQFGFATDNHLCNRHARLDVLNAAYDRFVEEGITEVFNAGNWVEGEAKFNRQELIVPPGMDPQLDYWIENYPHRKDVTTYFITGDDHEGWWVQRERINVGQYAQMKAVQAGRTDLKYLGHVEADVELRSKKGSAVMRVMHPGGGSAYALSYAPQKLVESFQGGEKPAVLLIGHYHKFDYCYPREVHVVSGGCTCDQTAFLRKNKIGVHVGFSLIRIAQDVADGHITRLAVEWFPYYDRKYYERRFG